MTNVTISISTLQIFRSWVAIFQPRPPTASLFRSLYGMPGLAARMDVLSWGRHDFQISFSNRDTSRNAWNRHWGSFKVEGDLIKQYEVSLSQMLNDILWPDHIQWQLPTDQTLYRTRPFTEFWMVSIEHLRRVWHADRGRLLLRTPGPFPFGICRCPFVETTDTQSYIRPPIPDSCPDLTSYRIWLLSLIWHHQFMALSLSWPLTEFDIANKGFHGACKTGVACRQGTLTPPDTWSRPFGNCMCSTCWDQSFSELVVISRYFLDFAYCWWI